MHDSYDEAERKLAAIMAADVVGFSRLIGADETAALASLDHARRTVIDPLVAQYRGRVFKVMGDGLLTEFPSSMLALRAAIAIQSGLDTHDPAAPGHPRIVLRIGIHQGDVLVQGDDLLGEGVNIATRLEPLAPAGGICVSARVREDAFGKMSLPFEEGGEFLLKNIARPISVYFLQTTRPNQAGPPAVAGVQPDARALPGEHRLIMLESSVGSPVPSHVVPIGAEPVTFGRQLPSDIILQSVEVSRVHCRVEVAAEGAIITDLRSTNGTFVDDRRIAEPTRLTTGTTVRIGPYRMRYLLIDPSIDPEATQIRAE